MLNGLLITYYFSPCNNVASLRPYSWFTNFSEHGINLTVVTRHWEGNEKTAGDFQGSVTKPKQVVTNQYGSVHYLPYIQPAKANKAGRLQQVMDIVDFTIQQSEVTSLEKNFYDECCNIITASKIDFIVVTAGPFSLFHLAKKLHKQYNIPYVVDFRDLWSLSEHKKDNSDVGFLTKVQNFFLRKKIRSWISDASLVSSVNNDLGMHLLKRLSLSGKNYMAVYNGYETELFKDTLKEAPSKFTFSVIGTIYPEQDIQLIIDAIRLFINKYSDNKDFVFNFIGTAVYNTIKYRIEKGLASPFVAVTDRVPRSEALGLMVNSHILFHCGWPTHIGISSGKIYEYIASGTKILIAPNDHGVMEKIITETNTGILADTTEHAFLMIEEEYLNWRNKTVNHTQPVSNSIRFYSRENQAKHFAETLIKAITNS